MARKRFNNGIFKDVSWVSELSKRDGVVAAYYTAVYMGPDECEIVEHNYNPHIPEYVCSLYNRPIGTKSNVFKVNNVKEEVKGEIAMAQSIKSTEVNTNKGVSSMKKEQLKVIAESYGIEFRTKTEFNKTRKGDLEDMMIEAIRIANEVEEDVAMTEVVAVEEVTTIKGVTAMVVNTISTVEVVSNKGVKVMLNKTTEVVASNLDRIANNRVFNRVKDLVRGNETKAKMEIESARIAEKINNLMSKGKNGLARSNKGVSKYKEMRLTSIVASLRLRGDIELGADRTVVKRLISNLIEENAFDVKTIQKASKLMLKKKRVKVSKLIISKDENGTFISTLGFDYVYENQFINEAEIVGLAKVTKNGASIVVDSKEDYTKDYVVVEFDGCTKLDKLSILKGDIFINNEDNQVFLGQKDSIEANGVKYTETVTGEDDVEVTYGSDEYKMFAYTTGGVKKNSALLYKASLGSAFDIIDKQLLGIMNNMVDNHGGSAMSKREAIKFAARPMLAFSPNVAMGTLQRIDVLNGSFDTTEYVDEKGNVDGTNNTSDGQIYVSEEWVRRTFGIAATERDVNFILQGRIYGIAKFQAIVVSEMTLKSMIASKKRQGENMEVQGDDTIAPQILLDLNAIKVKDVKFIDTDLYNKNPLVPEEIDFSLLAVGKLSNGGSASMQALNKLVVLAAEEGLSKDIIRQIEMLGEEFLMDEFNSVATVEKSLPKADSSYVLDILSAIAPNNPVVMKKRIEDKISTMANVINKLAFPLYFRDEEGNKKHAAYNAVVAGDISAIYGVKLLKKDEVIFGHVSSKMAKLENKIERLNKNAEGNATKIEKLQAELDLLVEQYGKTVGIKYPSMGSKEFVSARVISVNVILDRIKEHTQLTQVEKNGLKAYFTRNLSEATVMFAADKAVFKTCAGMDTDFDKILLIFHPLFVDNLYGKEEMINIDASIMPELENKVKDIMGKEVVSIFSKAAEKIKSERSTSDSLNNKEVFNLKDEDFYTELFTIQSSFEGLIGIITHHNDKNAELLARVSNGNLNASIELLDNIIGKDNHNIVKGKKYTKMADGEIMSPKYIDSMIKTIATVEWNKENLIAFHQDCGVAFRLYQETTIDAAKTGIYLAVRLNFSSLQISSLLNVSKNSENKIVRKEFKERETIIENALTGETVNVTVKKIDDTLGQIQDKLIEQVNSFFVKELEEIGVAFYTDTELKAIKHTRNSLAANEEIDKLVISKLHRIRDTYNDITGRYIDLLEEINKAGGEDIEDKIDVARESYDEDLKTLSIATHNILSRIDAIYGDRYTEDKLAIIKGRLMLSISMFKRNGQDVETIDGKRPINRFAYALAPSFVYRFLAGSKYFNAEATVVQLRKVDTNPVQTFIGGISEEGTVLKEDFTGTIDLTEIDNNNKVVVVKEFKVDEDVENASDKVTIIIRKNALTDEMDLQETFNADSTITVFEDEIKYIDNVEDENASYTTIGKTVDMEIFDGLEFGEISEFFIEKVVPVTMQFNDKKYNERAFVISGDDNITEYLLISGTKYNSAI